MAPDRTARDRRPSEYAASGHRDHFSTSTAAARVGTRRRKDIGKLHHSRRWRMQYLPRLLDGFLAKTGLDLSNFHN